LPDNVIAEIFVDRARRKQVDCVVDPNSIFGGATLAIDNLHAHSHALVAYMAARASDDSIYMHLAFAAK
jgi:hypothetical protein